MANYLIDRIKNNENINLLWYGGYSLYITVSFMVFHSMTVISSSGEIDFGSGAIFLIGTLASRLIVLILAACFFRQILKLGKHVLGLISLAFAGMGFLVLAMLFNFSGVLEIEQITPWLALSGAFLGIGDGLLLLLWARFSRTLSLPSVYLFVVASHAVSLLIYFVVTLLPAFFALPLAVLLFALSVIFVQKSLGSRELTEWEFSKPLLQGTFRHIGSPVLGTSILAFVAGLMLQISGQQELPLESFQFTSLTATAVAIAFLLLPALIMSKPLDFGKMFVVAIPLSAAGFLLLPIIWNAAGGIVNAFAHLGVLVAGIMLWCMLSETSADTGLPSLLLFALAYACTNAAQLAGTLLGYFNAATLERGGIRLTAFALVAVYILFMAALFLFKDKSFKGKEEEGEEKGEAPPTSMHPSLEQRCASLAEQHQFTPRESEVFVFLAQGFTIPAVSEKLYVSENTVKSYVKSIYRKLDIHSRSELIDLVNTE